MKLTDIEKLKYWLDAEISLINVKIAVVLWFVTHNFLFHVILALYITGSLIYALSRVAYLSKHDKDYLKLK